MYYTLPSALICRFRAHVYYFKDIILYLGTPLFYSHTWSVRKTKYEELIKLKAAYSQQTGYELDLFVRGVLLAETK